MKKICVLLSIISIATASVNTETDNLLSTALKFVRDCGDRSMLSCAKVSKFSTKKICPCYDFFGKFLFDWILCFKIQKKIQTF